MNKTLIIFHKDLDGYFSALSYAINELNNSQNNKTNENNDYVYLDSNGYLDYSQLHKKYDFFFIDYSNENLFFKLEKIGFNLDNYEKVVMLDFSCELETMEFLVNKFKENFIWIDHHKRVYEEYNQKLNIKGLTDSNHAACRLVWNYFNKIPPKIIDYIEDMDLWLWKQDRSMEILSVLELLFNNMINIDHNYFLKLLSDRFFLENKKNLIEEGELIIKNRDINVNRDISNGKVINFENHKTFIVNSLVKPGFISEKIFNNKDQNQRYENIEVVLVWFRSHKLNLDKVSLRSNSDEIDCSKLATIYGGNGHPRASGFVIDKIDKIY